METNLRLQNELKNFLKTKSFGFYARPSPKNALEWSCQFYHDGYFFGVTMIFSHEYPFKPPSITFNDKIYHPNVYSDNHICLDIISSKWSPSLTIKDILTALKQLLDCPNPKSPANGKAGSLYSKDINKYKEKVKETNEKHNKFYKKVKFSF